MIVNPQIFSYKIIIGSLIVTFAFVGVFGFSAYQSNKAEHLSLKQEKKHVESELSQMILRYDAISQTSTILSEQLDSIKLDAKSSSEKLRLMASDFSVFTSVKSDLSDIKSKNTFLFKIVDSIRLLNERLEKEKLMANNALKEQKKVNNALLKTNKSLNDALEKESLLTATSFNAKAYKSAVDTIETTKASRANFINVCFTLAENTLTEKGIKEIYIQILDPLNNVFRSKGAVEFGNALLIYSDKQLINYNNEMMDICTTVNAESKDIPFSKGTYFVSVFHKERKLGSTQIILN
ncbi:MAG: hypothetical protein WA749_15860 [Gelidibacter sp.]